MGLLGRADATLVQAAKDMAMADVPADMSGIYAKRAANLKTFTKGIQAAWDSQFEAYNAFETRIINASDLALTNTLEGKTNDSMLAEVDRETREIKALMQGFDKKDKGNLEWKKLEARTNKLAATTKNNDETWNSLIDASANGDLLVMGMGAELDLYEAMINDYNNNTNETNGRIVDGDFVYSLPGNPDVTMTMNELKKNLKIKDATAPSAVMTIFSDIQKNAKTSKRPWDDEYETDTRNSIIDHLKTANDRHNVIVERFPGMKYSFWEAVTGKDEELQGQIYDALEAIGTDIDNDGVTDDALTYANPENAVALQKEIINNANSKDLIANFLTNNIGEKQYNLGRNNRVYDTTKAYKNRNVDIDMFLRPLTQEQKDAGEKGRSKFTTTSDTMIKWDKDLQAMEKTGKDSIFSEEYVNINGVKYGYDPKKGFREVEDHQQTGLFYKHNTRYFKTPEDIFKYHNIPLTYISASENIDNSKI